MPVNRQLFSAELSDSSCPPWPCCSCAHGTLVLDQATFLNKETPGSIFAREADWWEPEMLQARFSCMCVCSNPDCRDLAVVAGISSVEFGPTEPDGRGGWEAGYIDSFAIKFVYPAPRLIRVSDETPTEVANHLDRACSLFWHDKQSCINALRSCIESALTAYGVRRVALVKVKGKPTKRRKSLSLHERIVELKSKDADLAELLMATKWIGNAGTHGATISPSDVFDTFDFVEACLDRMFDNTQAKLKLLAKRVNQSKGPVASKAKRRLKR